jgi:2-oxoglutarate ferredoxin oxidoreductase subunit alpha
MMEKVWLDPQKQRSKTVPEWATTGKPPTRKRNIITSLELDPNRQEIFNQKLVAKYNEIKKNEVRFDEYLCEDAEYLLVAFGTCARVCQKSVELAREQGIKAGLLRPVTLFPFPATQINERADKIRLILTVEMNAGQMVEDVMLAVNGKAPVHFYGRMGGMIPTPDEVVDDLKKLIKRI